MRIIFHTMKKNMFENAGNQNLTSTKHIDTRLDYNKQNRPVLSN